MSLATSEFDPYQQWLGIAPHERPADHYRLLGLPRFETDVERIARAADERMALVRSYQTGPRGSHTQRILNEISAARVCLLDRATKAAYDSALHQMLAQLAARQTAAPPTAAIAPAIAPPPVPPPLAAPFERRLPERQVAQGDGERLLLVLAGDLDDQLHTFGSMTVPRPSAWVT